MTRALMIAWMTGLLCSVALADDQEARVAASRDLVTDFGGELKSKLKEALENGGPARAIGVCSSIAPEIAARASKRTGWEVGRTALKLRNRSNRPDAWEKTVLEEFERRRASGEDPGKMEYYGIIEEGGKEYFRYMKAIPMQAVCTVCHGKSVSRDIMDTLDSLYPDDEARGFDLGTVRGAFTVTQPIQGKHGK